MCGKWFYPVKRTILYQIHVNNNQYGFWYVKITGPNVYTYRMGIAIVKSLTSRELAKKHVIKEAVFSAYYISEKNTLLYKRTYHCAIKMNGKIEFVDASYVPKRNREIAADAIKRYHTGNNVAKLPIMHSVDF